MKKTWMRWALYLGGGLLGVVALVVAIGYSRPALVNAQCEITIRKPVPEVFALAADPLRTKDWFPEVEKVEILSQQPLRYRMSAAGMSSDMEVSLLVPNERMVVKTLSHPMGMSAEWDTRFAAAPEGTRIVHTARMNFSNPILRFLTIFMDAQEEEKRTLVALQKYAESH